MRPARVGAELRYRVHQFMWLFVQRRHSYRSVSLLPPPPVARCLQRFISMTSTVTQYSFPFERIPHTVYLLQTRACLIAWQCGPYNAVKWPVASVVQSRASTLLAAKSWVRVRGTGFAYGDYTLRSMCSRVPRTTAPISISNASKHCRRKAGQTNNSLDPGRCV